MSCGLSWTKDLSLKYHYFDVLYSFRLVVTTLVGVQVFCRGFLLHRRKNTIIIMATWNIQHRRRFFDNIQMAVTPPSQEQWKNCRGFEFGLRDRRRSTGCPPLRKISFWHLAVSRLKYEMMIELINERVPVIRENGWVKGLSIQGGLSIQFFLVVWGGRSRNEILVEELVLTTLHPRICPRLINFSDYWGGSFADHIF